MSSRRTVPDSSNRNTTTRPHRSDSNHTTQSTSSRGGGGSGRGGGGTLSSTRGGRGASYGNNSSSLNDNNVDSSSSSKNIQQQQQQPSSQQQQHQQMMSHFNFQHHHQHQPFFHHPALGGFASSSSSASGQQTQQQGVGSNPNQQQNGAVASPVASQHHHHHHPHHHANYPAPNPNILTGSGAGGAGGAGGVPNHHIHSHHHFHHFLQQHHHIFAHHHHHHQHFAAAAAAAQQQQQQQAANSGNTTTNNSNSNGVANNSSRNTPRSSVINNPGGSSSTPNTGGERNPSNNVTSSGNGNLPLSVMGNTLMNNSNSTNNNGPGSSTSASGHATNFPPPGSALTASTPNPIYILNTANRDGETQVFDFKNRPIEHATSGNLATFLSSISPSVTTTASHYGDGSDGESYYMIPEMMLAFHAPFGVAINLGEVGVTLSESHPPERELYYTPQLSGFKFEIRAAEPPPINMTFGGKNNKNNSKANSKIGTPTTSTDPFSTEPEIYQWYEDAKPEARAPLCNQFKELLERPEYARIKTLKSTECTVTSWFCVLWVPIHVKTHTPQASAGSFLVFYLVNPPSNMPNSRYRKGDPSCFYFRADPYSVSPLEFLNAPRFARACDAFASKSAPRIKKPKVSMLNSETLEKINTQKQQEDGEEQEDEQQLQKDNQNNTEGESNKNNNKDDAENENNDDDDDDDVEMIEEIHDPPVQRMRIPVFGLIPCRISAEIWYARFSYYASNGMPVSCYAGPLFLLYCAMQLMNWEKARMTQFYMSKGKPLLEAHGLASVLPDYDHLMRHETRLNAFLNNYVC